MSKKTTEKELQTVEIVESEEDNRYEILDNLANRGAEYRGNLVSIKEVTRYYKEHLELMSKRKHSGRPTSLIPTIFLKIIELKELYSLPDLRICAAVGVTHNNFMIWKRKGALPRNDAEYSKYFEYFLWIYLKASTILETECLDNVKAAGSSRWEASKWLLTKVQNERYGDRIGSEAVQSTNTSIDKQMNINIALSLDDLKSINASLEEFISDPIVLEEDE